MKKITLITFLVIGGLFFTQQALALTISPPRMELSADPGQKFGEVIKLFNETDSVKTIYTSTANFTAKQGEEGVPMFLEAEENSGLADWIEIEKGPITLFPSERKEIPFTVSVPKFADPGGHYAAVFFGDKSPEAEGGAVEVAGKLGSLILLRVSGDIKEKGRLIEFSLADGKDFYEHLPVSFVAGLENSGNVHLKPKGEILIKNILGFTSDKVEVNKRGGNVLPGTNRHFESSWLKTPFEGTPSGFWQKLNVEKNNFALGRYKAELILGYGTNGEQAIDDVVFWVFPWHLLLVSGILIALLIFLIILVIGRYNRWIVRKAMESRV